MMSKPAPEREEKPPAFATPPPQLSSVEDLERKLKMLSDVSVPEPAPAAPAPAPVVQEAAKPPAAAPAAAAPMSGKSALLVRTQRVWRLATADQARKCPS